MKAEELRINNLVLNNGCICKICHIYGELFINCTLKTKQGNIINAHYDLIKPIPLTEEWLLKFGFVFKKQLGICGQDQWSGMDFYLKDNITLRGNLKKSSTLSLAEYFNCQIQYVHQLQNLYFALTGTELIINEACDHKYTSAGATENFNEYCVKCGDKK